jgi:hypothetical protein
VPVSASHHRKGAQAGSRVAAQNRGHWRLRKLSVGAFREHSNAGGGAHETVQRLWVRSDLPGQFLRRLGSRLDEVRDTELRQARDLACDVSPSQQLVRRRVQAGFAAVASFVLHVTQKFLERARLNGADCFAFEESGVGSEAEGFQQVGLHLR